MMANLVKVGKMDWELTMLNNNLSNKIYSKFTDVKAIT